MSLMSLIPTICDDSFGLFDVSSLTLIIQRIQYNTQFKKYNEIIKIINNFDIQYNKYID